jgi:hypothetical protein
MQTTYKQVADRFVGDDDVQNPDNRSNNRGPTRERELRDKRLLSASQRSMNSMSRTIDPHYAANYHQETKQMSPARTIGSATRQKSSMYSSNDDGKYKLYQINKINLSNILDGGTLRDNPNRDAFGPKAKDLKIQNLRTYVKNFF